MDDRRRCRRFRPFRADSSCTVVGPQNFLGRATLIEIVNVSADGLCVRAIETIEPGECVRGSFAIAVRDEIHYTGRVVWASVGETTLAGLKFSDDDPVRESRLENARRRSGAGWRCR